VGEWISLDTRRPEMNRPVWLASIWQGVMARGYMTIHSGNTCPGWANILGNVLGWRPSHWQPLIEERPTMPLPEGLEARIERLESIVEGLVEVQQARWGAPA
jgi:hypothetical protein